ncbi:GNAT family N-acetyltransferase [Rothia aerolata]|nr:GNAT family N-acetyltransferase [Rothia aerolata]
MTKAAQTENAQPQIHIKTFDELTTRELHAIYVTRGLVFTVGQKITDQEVDDTDLVCFHLFTQNKEGKVTAYLRMYDLGKYADESHEITPGAWTIGRVAVLDEARGTGLGRRIVAEAIEWIRDNTDAERIEISAQQYLENSLYGKAGFVTEGEPYIEAGIEHVHMNLVLER